MSTERPTRELETALAAAEARVRELEAALAAATRRADELRDAAVAAERLNAELARSNRELELFAYAASHDLRAPLRTVTGFVELLDQHLVQQGVNLDERYVSYRDRIVRGTLTMHELIDALLAYSRVSSQGGPLDDEVDLDRALRDASEALLARLDQVGGTVRSDPLPTVRGDAVQLRQVLQNLVDNSLKHHHPARPPVVELTADRTGAGWLVTVRDNGVGVPEGMEEHAFQMFKRLRPTVGRADEGVGMGLALCRRIVERHGGRIWIEPGTVGGTTVRFLLPHEPPSGPIPSGPG